ncbi:hypothetical protein MMN80_29795 [Escherichia coli]|nr:hypothetical protein [Escherichia coli]
MALSHTANRVAEM